MRDQYESFQPPDNSTSYCIQQRKLTVVRMGMLYIENYQLQWKVRTMICQLIMINRRPNEYQWNSFHLQCCNKTPVEDTLTLSYGFQPRDHAEESVLSAPFTKQHCVAQQAALVRHLPSGELSKASHKETMRLLESVSYSVLQELDTGDTSGILVLKKLSVLQKDKEMEWGQATQSDLESSTSAYCNDSPQDCIDKTSAQGAERKIEGSAKELSFTFTMQP